MDKIKTIDLEHELELIKFSLERVLLHKGSKSSILLK